jgi:beta-glucosidase
MIHKKLFAALLVLQAVGMQAQQALPPYLDETLPLEQRVSDALQRMTLDEKIAVIHAQSKFSAPGVPRLGFPDLWTDDGPHGVRPDVLWDEWVQAGQTNDSCVAFPALTCLAATWNPQMARLYGESLGEEALYRGKSVILGPGVNILRTPLNGRNFEYMGEDPWLASRMVVPYVQGLQSRGVAACVKHYALNNDEDFRHQVNVIVSDRALHEIYLPAFRAAVQEGGAWSIMGAYNLYRDQHNCHNAVLLNKILKGDWQFDGVVISDWGGCHDTDEAVRNGLDLEMGTWTDGLTMGRTNAYDSYHMAVAYKQAILSGKYSTRELDEKVRRLLRLYFRTTMNRHRPQGFLCSESHYATALRIAQEGIVLLKNSPSRSAAPLLPLDTMKYKKILVVGENAIKMMTVGGGSSSLKVQKEILPLDGLSQALTGHRYSLPSPLGERSGVRLDYARGYVGDTVQSFDGVSVGRSLYDTRSAEELTREAVEKARLADVVIFIGGLNKSDRQDSEGHDRQQYGLPYGQDQLIEALADANPNLVYVNVSGNPVAMPWLSRVPAVVQAWFIGSEAGEALASVLCGSVNPSGKLPYTWYASLEQCGAHATGSYPGTWRADHKIIDEEYLDDIFVGYRWMDLPLKDKAKQLKASSKSQTSNLKPQINKPLFPFGHGLSYTTFELKNPRADKRTMTADEQLTVSVDVTNTGSRQGAEVVQLYVSDLKASVPRPVKELKGFSKVSLQPGETKTVSITIDRQALSFYDETSQAWKAEPGDFDLLVGTSSAQTTGKLRLTLR